MKVHKSRLVFILLRCGKITQKLWSCDIFLIPKYNCDGFCNTLVDRVFGNQNYSPVQACAFVPGLKIWMEFFFFIGSILFLMQLHMHSCCNDMVILVFIGSSLFLLQLHAHMFPRSIRRKALVVSTNRNFETF